LDVIVSVNEEGRCAGAGPAPFSESDRVATRFGDFGLQAGALERLGDPLGGTACIGPALGAGAHRRDPEEFEKLVPEPGEVRRQIRARVPQR
jgi:hypothetical protein